MHVLWGEMAFCCFGGDCGTLAGFLLLCHLLSPCLCVVLVILCGRLGLCHAAWQARLPETGHCCYPRPGCWVHALLLLCAIVGLCVLLASSSFLAGPLVGGTVPHCFAMYLTAPLPNHVPTSLLPSQSVFLPDYLALSWP